MISLKSRREIQIMQDAGSILKKVFSLVRPALKAGMTTLEIDLLAEKIIREAGGEPAFKGYRGFPATACISVNEEVVHGIPGPKKIRDGDLISVDVGVLLKGYYADAARTWPIGDVGPGKQRLIETAEGSMRTAVGRYQTGWRIGDLSAHIQAFIEERNYGIVRDYVGHGIGRAIHEDPQVPNYGKAGQGPRMESGLVLAIEPMVTEGGCAVETLKDGWTVVTKDRKLSSHYEDTIAFTDEGVINLTGDPVKIINSTSA